MIKVIHIYKNFKYDIFSQKLLISKENNFKYFKLYIHVLMKNSSLQGN